MYQEVYLYVSLVSLFTHAQRDLQHVTKTKVTRKYEGIYSPKPMNIGWWSCGMWLAVTNSCQLIQYQILYHQMIQKVPSFIRWLQHLCCTFLFFILWSSGPVFPSLEPIQPHRMMWWPFSSSSGALVILCAVFFLYLSYYIVFYYSVQMDESHTDLHIYMIF